jgi:hypothetical protein
VKYDTAVNFINGRKSCGINSASPPSPFHDPPPPPSPPPPPPPPPPTTPLFPIPPLSSYDSCLLGTMECLHRLQNSAPVISSTLFSMTCLPQNYNKKMVCCRCVASICGSGRHSPAALARHQIFILGVQNVSPHHVSSLGVLLRRLQHESHVCFASLFCERVSHQAAGDGAGCNRRLVSDHESNETMHVVTRVCCGGKSRTCCCSWDKLTSRAAEHPYRSLCT